uniref:Uncharacterized protein n=1 Tax=Timema tahoe TaxID=61484 RepID=A0A7R9NZ42_9NEOP|nr:unnamed protein product [Timema tahoe]
MEQVTNTATVGVLLRGLGVFEIAEGTVVKQEDGLEREAWRVFTDFICVSEEVNPVYRSSDFISVLRNSKSATVNISRGNSMSGSQASFRFPLLE